MELKFISNNRHPNKKITDISIDMVDIERKTFYGEALYFNWANMNMLGRIILQCNDDNDFNKVYELYKKGCNMHKVINNQIIIY